MCYLCIMKRLSPFSSKFAVRCIFDSGSKLLTRSRKIAGERQTSVSFSSLGPDSRNDQVQVSESTDEVKILHFLNTMTAEEMREDKHISYRMSEMICKHREANGHYSTLKDLLKVKLIGPKNLEVLREKFLSTDDIKTFTRAPKRDSIEKYISPELDSSLIESASTVTTLEVCIDSVCYCTMSRDMQVLDWNHVTLTGSNHQNQTPAQILDQAYHVLNHLPKSTIVLMENRLSRKITPQYLHYLLFIGRLQMAVQTLLNEDLRASGQHKVFHVKDSFVINLFQLRVGGERVSGQNIVQQIQNGESAWEVSFLPKIWQRYNRLEAAIFRERYSNCLLMSLAFCQQVLVNRSLGDEDDSLE